MIANRKSRRAARRLFRLCLVNGALDEARTRQIIGRIAAAPRRDTLGILSDLRRRVRLELARHTALVESAEPLPDDVQASVVGQLATMYGPHLKTTFAVTPALVGGMRVTAGSDVYDGSVRARLAALQGRL